MSNVAVLEKVVAAEVDAGKFNVNTAADLVKEYNATKVYNKDLLVKVLFRSLAQFDTSDFDALYVQLPQSYTAVELTAEKAVLFELDNFLHSAQFSAFWAALPEAKAKLGVPSLQIEDAVRTTIIAQLSRAVVSLSEKDAAEALNVATKDLAKAFASVGATVANGKVSFPANNTNNGGPAKKAADVTLEKLVALQQ